MRKRSEGKEKSDREEQQNKNGKRNLEWRGSSIQEQEEEEKNKAMKATGRGGRTEVKEEFGKMEQPEPTPSRRNPPLSSTNFHCERPL